jgi:nitrate reductase NapE component
VKEYPKRMLNLFSSLKRAVSGMLAAGVLGLTLLATTPALVEAQTSGANGPVVGKVAPGQSAGQVEGTTESGLTYAANVIFPLLAVAFICAVVFCVKTGRGWVVSAVCATLCLMISGITRLLEYHITQGANGIK